MVYFWGECLTTGGFGSAQPPLQKNNPQSNNTRKSHRKKVASASLSHHYRKINYIQQYPKITSKKVVSASLSHHYRTINYIQQYPKSKSKNPVASAPLSHHYRKKTKVQQYQKITSKKGGFDSAQPPNEYAQSLSFTFSHFVYFQPSINYLF